jgi:DNA-binding transcriptional MerR regulator
MPSETAKKLTLDDLGSLTGCSRRTARYYIHIGLLPRPAGAGRAAHYTSGHLDTLLRIKRLSDAGVSLERIREVLAGGEPPVPPRARRPGEVEVRSHLHIAPGIEIQITPGQNNLSPEKIRAFAREVMAVAAKTLPATAPRTSCPARSGRSVRSG